MPFCALATVAASGVWLGREFWGADRTLFLPGATTHGHYQIEMRCESCHAAFDGVSTGACLACHEEELDRVRDTHPRSKFTDPRNAPLLEKLNALECATCHEEHVPERTGTLGVTLPMDYCSYCHAEIAVERPSHAGFDFFSCSRGGCHNYHDNSMLYEDFIAERLDQPPLLAAPATPPRTRRPAAGAAPPPDPPPERLADARVLEEWAASAHAAAGVNCSDCHGGAGGAAWRSDAGIDVCRRCHEPEAKGFLESRHGMRIAAGLDPMRPELARLSMRPEARSRALGCTTCHGAHAFDTRTAAVDACLDCHADEHSLAYIGSPHHRTWTEAMAGRAPEETGVSCATCHLPRAVTGPADDPSVVVIHNQNDSLRPNVKALRPACLACHGYSYAVDALADRALIDNNFTGHPSVRVESSDLVRRRRQDEAAEKGGVSQETSQ